MSAGCPLYPRKRTSELSRGAVSDIGIRANADAGRLCQRFDDANVTLGGVAQHLQCGLIAGAVEGGDGVLHAVEFDEDNALDDSLLVSFGGVAAGEKAASSSDHCWSRELGVFGKGVLIGNRTIGRNYIGFWHWSPCSLDVLSAPRA